MPLSPLRDESEIPAPAQAGLRTQQSITLGLLFLSGLVNFFDRSSLSIANTTVSAEMHLSATQMGWLLSCFSFSYALAQLPLVGVLERLGSRVALGGGLTVWSAAQLVTGFVRSFGSFLGLRILLGFGEAPFYPVSLRCTREWFTTATRGRAVALVNSASFLGLAVSPPFLTWLMLRMGWRGMFMVLGGAGLLVAVAWLVMHRERKNTAFAEPVVEGAASVSGAWKVLLKQRMVWGMMLGWSGINYTVWLYITWLPAYLQKERHLSIANSGWVAAIPYLCGVLGMALSGIVSDWRGHRGTALAWVHRSHLIVGMTLSAAATFFVAHAGSTRQAVVGFSLAFFCIHFAGNSGWGYVQSVSPLRYVASVAAIQNFASYAVASIGPILTGILLDRTHSFGLALGVCSAMTLIGALSYATIGRPSGELANAAVHAG